MTKKKSLFEDSQSQDEAKDDKASANENKSTKKKVSEEVIDLSEVKVRWCLIYLNSSCKCVWAIHL